VTGVGVSVDGNQTGVGVTVAVGARVAVGGRETGVGAAQAVRMSAYKTANSE
jgi:hypothetical protein